MNNAKEATLRNKKLSIPALALPRFSVSVCYSVVYRKSEKDKTLYYVGLVSVRASQSSASHFTLDSSPRLRSAIKKLDKDNNTHTQQGTRVLSRY